VEFISALSRFSRAGTLLGAATRPLLRAFSGPRKGCCETGRADDGRESTRHGSEDWRLGFQPTPVRLGRFGANGHLAPFRRYKTQKERQRSEERRVGKEGKGR